MTIDPHETNASSSRATRLGVAARAPLDPGAVLVGDERGQRRAVVVRGHGSEAAAADERDAAALGLDAPSRLRVVRRRDQLLLAGAHLQARASPGRLRAAARPDRSAARSPPRARAGRARTPRARRHPGLARHACASACRCCRAAARSTASARARAAARGGARRRCRSACPAGSRLRRRARREDPRAAGRRRRRVLRCPSRSCPWPSGRRRRSGPRASASSSSLTKTPRAPISPNGPRPVAVARRRDRHERDLDPGPAQPLCGLLRLGEREPTAAGADADQHSFAGRRASTRRSPASRSAGCSAGCGRTPSAPAAAAACST